MNKDSTMDAAPLLTAEVWFDPIEAELRERIRGFLEEMIEQEVTTALGRSRYQRGAGGGYRNGHPVAAPAWLIWSRRDRGSSGPVIGCGRD